MSSDSCHVVAVLAIPAVVGFDLSVPCHVFGHERESTRYSVEVCASQASVPTTTGYAIGVPYGLDALARAQTVIVAGFERSDSPPDESTLEALRDAHRRGARIVSICTGAFALAAAGLLDGRRATTHWRDAGKLAERHPAIRVQEDVLYVDEGDILTSAGVAAGIDLCLHLVRGDYGVEAANSVARRMVVAPLRAGGQAQFVERPVAGDDGGLAATRAWMLDRLALRTTVGEMAAHAGYSERSFHRRFAAETSLPPLRWLQEQRVHEARRLLQGSEASIEEVAARCGFGSAAALRTQFARSTHTTPTGYRSAWLERKPGG